MQAKTQLMLREQGAVTLDVLSLFWIVIAFTLFLYTATFVDQNMNFAVKGVIVFGLLIGGLFMTHITVGLKWDPYIDRKEWGAFSAAFTFSLFTTWSTNLLVNSFFTASIVSYSPMPSSLFSILVGISEEPVFRGFFLSLFELLTGSAAAGVLVSSIIFPVFHGAIYGFQPAALLIVTLGGFFLGVAFLIANKRLSATMTAHGCINLLSFLLGG